MNEINQSGLYNLIDHEKHELMNIREAIENGDTAKALELIKFAFVTMQTLSMVLKPSEKV